MKQSVITVYCSAPFWLSGTIERILQERKSLLLDKGIIEVTIDDLVVLEPVSLESKVLLYAI